MKGVSSCFGIFYDDPTLSDITMSKAGTIRRKAFNSTMDHLLERYLKTRWIHSIFLYSLSYGILPLLTILSIANVASNPSIATKFSVAFAVIILHVWLAFNIYACLQHSNRENSVIQIELTQQPPNGCQSLSIMLQLKWVYPSCWLKRYWCDFQQVEQSKHFSVCCWTAGSMVS